jgi:SPP1 family predicted phage head-tail adaptor
MLDLLNRSLDVARETSAPDGMGGTTTTLATVGTVAAKVDQPSTAEQQVAAQSGSRHTHNAYFAPTADVRRGDTLTGDGDTFDVLSVVEPSEPIYRKAQLELIQSEGA